jgi:uncharacterized protein (DUF952 family)
MMTTKTYHLVPRPYFESQDPSTDYYPEAFAREGFIHTTDGDDELILTANRHCKTDSRPYLVLEIDLTRVVAPVRYDDSRRIYPHIYGGLNRDAIVEIRSMRRDADGTFLGVEAGPSSVG